MKSSIIILMLLIGGIHQMQAKAQVAAYICWDTGAFGYCYGNNQAKNCAYQKALAYGATSPYLVFSTYSKGYGAIAVGTNSNGVGVIGVSGGYSTLRDAKIRAVNECARYGGQNVYVHDSWSDDYE